MKRFSNIRNKYKKIIQILVWILYTTVLNMHIMYILLQQSWQKEFKNFQYKWDGLNNNHAFLKFLLQKLCHVETRCVSIIFHIAGSSKKWFCYETAMDGATFRWKTCKNRDTCLDPFHFSYYTPGSCQNSITTISHSFCWTLRQGDEWMQWRDW